MKLIPSKDQVVLKRYTVESKSAIYAPQAQEKNLFTVIEIGETEEPIVFETQNIVVVRNFSQERVKLGEEVFAIVNVKDVLAVIEE